MTTSDKETMRGQVPLPQEQVTLETMPDCHRASHRAARNWGRYPANGAERSRVSREEAGAIVAADARGASSALPCRARPRASATRDNGQKETRTMKTYTLTNDDAKNVRFTGELLGEVSSHSHFGSRQNRWTELDLYRTAGGKLVLQIVGRTCWQGESDRHEVLVLDAEAALVDALIENNGGQLGDLAKELLEAVGVDHAEEVA